MRKLEIEKLKFSENGLIPAIVQDADTKTVLMLGYMNRTSLKKTLDINKVTFYSRSKQRLWTKGEKSGNFLHLVSVSQDCDSDALLVKAKPAGATCHTGTATCWGEENVSDPLLFIRQLADVIQDRYHNPDGSSYTSSLFRKGINKVAQKVGEEAVELVIEAKDQNKDLFCGEAADLLYHFLVLLQAKEIDISDILEVLKQRHK